MSASSNSQTPPIATSQNAAAANLSSSGSANVAAGQAPPTATARSSYAKKVSSPPIASSAAPPVAVGGPQSAQNGSTPIKPAVPAMGPTIVNSSAANGAASQGDHSRKSSVTISAAGTSGYIPNGGPVPNSRAPSNLTFGSLAGSPALSHATPHPQGQNLNPQAPNPRVASPAHSPSPIPTPISSGGKPDSLPTRPGLVFGGGSDSAESNSRPISLPPQPNSLPQAQHLRRESSQSAHSDMSNQNMSRGFPPNGGRGRGFNNYPQMHPGASPQPYRALPNQPRGPNMAPAFQPQMHPNSPYRANRSPAITPAAIHQQANYTGYNYGQQPYPQPGMYGPPQGLDPYGNYYGQGYPNQYNGMAQGMHYPGVPASPGRGHGFPQQTYPVPAYGQPPQAQGMSRTPSNMSERPPSAAQQPSTPAMTNVSHVSQTPSAQSGSPAPASSFSIPSKAKSKAIVIKTADGKVVDFKSGEKPASPAQPPPPSKSPAIVATPTPPPRPESTHSRAESVATKSASEKKAEFIKQFQESLRAESQKEEDDKKKEEEAKIEADKAQKAKEEAEAAAKAEADKAAKEKEAAEAAKADEEEAKRKAEEEKRKQEEEMERMIEEMERAEKEEEERERKYAEEKKRKQEEEKAREAERAKEADERMKQAEREAEAAEAARSQETPEQKAEREKLFASLKKNTMFGPAAGQTETPAETPTPPAEPTVTPPTQPKTTGAGKPKPAHLKLETTKSVEPPAPTPGMMSLKSARFLQVQSELVKYPEGILSPNPALNVGTKSKGKVYEPSFLLQFQDVFKEKPSVDWDMKLKETVGDSSESAGPKSARGPSSMGMGGRQPSRSGLGGPMGSFQGSFPAGRTLPPGTTSAQRFEQSQRGPMTNPLAQFVAPPRAGGFPVQMARSSSFQNMGQAAPNSPRVGSSRGRGSRRGDKTMNKKEEAAMPLTSGMEIKALEKSSTGWTPHSKAQAPQQVVAGHMAPDMVQRKVKAALNKMTPEKFDKISDQILEIAGQSKNEDDGRTLRQVIQLTFEKACDEQHWSSMYAKFCQKMLMTMSTEIRDENVKDKHGQPVVGGALFRKYLLNRCQEEFEKGWEVNLPAKPEGEPSKEVMLSDEYYIAAAAKRKGLGLIQFIGELYKLNMLTLRIMHECVLKLLDFEGLPDESAIESLVKLLRTVGATMATADAGPKMLSVYFERVEKIMNMEGLPSRLKFMLLDLVDIRKANWHDKQADKGPKTIQQIHAEAAAAQQAAAQQAANQRGGRPPPGRGDARSFSAGGPPPPQDFGRVAMDDLRKLSKGASGRNSSGQLGPSMLGGRTGSGRRGLGPGGGLMGGAESGASSRTATPPVQKEKESTSHANSFSALMSLDTEGAGEVGSPLSNTSSPPQSKVAPARAKSPAVDAKPSE